MAFEKCTFSPCLHGKKVFCCWLTVDVTYIQLHVKFLRAWDAHEPCDVILHKMTQQWCFISAQKDLTSSKEMLGNRRPVFLLFLSRCIVNRHFWFGISAALTFVINRYKRYSLRNTHKINSSVHHRYTVCTYTLKQDPGGYNYF